MKKSKNTFYNIVLPTIVFTALVAIWQFAVRFFEVPEFILPAPSDIVSYVMGAIVDGKLVSAVFITLQRLLIGYFIGIFIGIPVGMLCSRFQVFKGTIGLLSLGLQALPSVCWVPLAILWFGLTESSMLFVVVMGSVWSVILATMHGVNNIPPIYLRAASTMGSKGLHAWLYVITPAAFPSILGGMKQGWAFAWRSLMAAEISVQIITGMGLGQLLDSGKNLSDMAQVMGVMFVVIFIGLIVDKAIFAPLEDRLRKKWGIS